MTLSGILHDIRVVYVCLKNLTFTFFSPIFNLIQCVIRVSPCGCFRTKLNRMPDMQCSSLLVIIHLDKVI